jgi:succinyl-CoA synthetase beta subunit
VLSVIDSLALVCAAGIPVVEACSAQDTGHLSFPVVAKHGGGSDHVVHKDSSGMVRRGLRDRASLAAAIAEIEGRARALGLAPEVVAQSQLEGPELFLGARRDPSFGPVVLLGGGGSMVEVAGGVEIMTTPFTLAEAEHRWNRSPVSRWVGNRVDVRQVASWLAGLARLLEVAEEIEEIDVNPLIVTPAGPFAVDARVVLSNSMLVE